MGTKTKKTSKSERKYHPWWDWECYKAGFYATGIPGAEDTDVELKYKVFLQDLTAFGLAMDRVMAEWPVSCEHFLTNTSLNRIAWLGQASMCLTQGVPSCYKGGFRLLSADEQKAANDLAQVYLTKWEATRG